VDSPRLVARPIAAHEGCAGNDRQVPPSLHYPATLERVGDGPVSHNHDRDRESFEGVVGDGPKPSANRGASGCDSRSLVERLNQTVSIRMDMADAPTHHNPDIHDSHQRGERIVHLRSPRPPTESDPSRADQRGQSEC
jgi:hypothetical protein